MIITRNQSEIIAAIKTAKTEKPDALIGLIPTMGALHEGHMSLVELAKNQCDIVICSVFVNPAQFNNPDDLATYPRTLFDDKKLLENNGCDILLLPTVEAVYPDGILPYEINLEGLDTGMEGTFRPGHFTGVCMVVQRFLEMVAPDKAYFGKKDFQQLAIIGKMAAIRNLAVEIVGAPIKRAENGLALSSRNALLTDQQRENASLISLALKNGMTNYELQPENEAIRAKIEAGFANSEFTIEYIAIVNNISLKEVAIADENCTVCIVVFCGKVRLLDNMQFADFASV
ncbi:MAG: pantoate--beta-alanine ligase [Crocinitomix sp.]|nr:pantoate--beta-alanine ligase [Crocinitomix sp.]